VLDERARQKTVIVGDCDEFDGSRGEKGHSCYLFLTNPQHISYEKSSLYISVEA